MISDSCHSARCPVRAGHPGRRGQGAVPAAGRLPGPGGGPPCARGCRGSPGRPRHAALLLSGCQDLEYSYDAHFDGRPNGAFTYVALKTLRELPAGATYREWSAAVARSLPSQDYPQTPGLDGSSTQRRWTVLT